MGPRLDEVVGPDMVGPAWPETDAGSVVEPQPPSFRLLLGNLQPLAPPAPLRLLVVYLPARGFEEGRDPAILVAAILAGQLGDRLAQRPFVVPDDRNTPLRRTRLSQIPACPAFRKTKPLADIDHIAPAALGTQKFPSAASFRTSFSKVRSATTRRRRPFAPNPSDAAPGRSSGRHTPDASDSNSAPTRRSAGTPRQPSVPARQGPRPPSDDG